MNKLDFKHLLKRLPLIQQQTQMDCGAACLATICRFDDKRVSLNRMRELTRVGQSGTSMYNIKQAAQSLGYEASAVLDIYENLEKSQRPSITNWCGYHWIVVYKATDKHVTIADPSQGIIKLSKQDFLEGWTRYTLYLNPTKKVKEIEESKPIMTNFYPYIKPYLRIILEIGLASLAMLVI